MQRDYYIFYSIRAENGEVHFQFSNFAVYTLFLSTQVNGLPRYKEKKPHKLTPF